MNHNETVDDEVWKRWRGVPAHEGSAEAFLHQASDGAPSATHDLAEQDGPFVTSPGEVTWLGSERVRSIARNKEVPRSGPSPRAIACSPDLQHLHEAWIANEVAAHCQHAVRGALGAVASSAFLLQRRLRQESSPLAKDRRISEPLGVIKARIHDMVATMDTKLVVPGTTSLGTLVLSDVVGALLGCIAVPEGVLLLVPDESPLRVVARKKELELALYCLLQNSVDAVGLKGGGAVRIEIHSGGKGHVLVEVSDDGIGIRSDVLSTVWDPFFTTKPDHLGLGLGIAKQLAERSRGSLGLDHANDGGVVATLKLRAPEG